MNEKKALRRLVRSQHGGEAARQQESLLICYHIMNSAAYRSAKVIGGYVPLRWEADITPVLQDSLGQGKTLALPLCGPAPEMTLRRVTSLEALVPGAYGIPEPAQDAPVIPPEQIDLLLVPLEAVSPQGMRLGKGGGYYDCLLAKADMPSMGCALSWQQAERVPADPWDRPLMASADRHGVRYFAINQRSEESKNAEKQE